MIRARRRVTSESAARKALTGRNGRERAEGKWRMENGGGRIANVSARDLQFLNFERRFSLAWRARGAEFVTFRLRPTEKKNAREPKKRLTLFFPTFTFRVQERRYSAMAAKKAKKSSKKTTKKTTKKK
jgi:hypothetical protein